jgi:hypothetical protein
VPVPKRFIVGREAELQIFDRMLGPQPEYGVLSIYGPGGIGKTEVRRKMEDHAVSKGIPFASIDGDSQTLTYDMLLYRIMEGIVGSSGGRPAEREFKRFRDEYEGYLTVENVLQQSGGLNSVFGALAEVKDPVGLAKVLGGLGEAAVARNQELFRNRFSLKGYLDRIDTDLTSCLSAALDAVQSRVKRALVVFLDTYEQIEPTLGLDAKICKILVPRLSDGVRVVALGRNALSDVSMDWTDLGDTLKEHTLPPLTLDDTKAYLSHYGLVDDQAQKHIFRLTQGYPLLLFLMRRFAERTGGWNAVGTIEEGAGLDYVTSALIDRLLREDLAPSVQDFLKRGVVVSWFDPGLVSVILDVDDTNARLTFERLRRHSFVEQNGGQRLCIKEPIRSLLQKRLRDDDLLTYTELNRKVDEYLKARSALP